MDATVGHRSISLRRITSDRMIQPPRFGPSRVQHFHGHIAPSRTSHHSAWNQAGWSVQQAADDVGGLAVAGFEEVGVDVQRRRGVGVPESSAHSADRDAGGE